MAPRVIVVSGGSRGLGQAIVQHRLEREAVCSFGRSRSEFGREALAKPEWSERFLFRELDVADAEGVRAFVREVSERFGRLDALVNNAGVAADGLLDRGLVTYASTKAALDGMTRALARELGGRGITVNGVVPPVIDFLPSPGASFITGQVLVVDGGISVQV